MSILKTHWNRHWLVTGLVLYAWIAVAYFLPNHYVIFQPREVALTAVDNAIPLSPAWVWIYISYYPFIVGAYFFAKAPANLRRFVAANFISALVAAVIFMIFPTHIDRDLYPLIESHGCSTWLLSYVRSLDNSVNCLPSMHIAMSCIAAFTYAAESRRGAIFGAGGALLITYSTMATKQHYFLDVVAGAILAAASLAIASKASTLEIILRRSLERLQS